ncbi:hypothetical protein ACOSZG_06045 [Vibrio alginolyticus]|uniref:hypothetical protein n=1 Tax=Vibrio alginolyticus TaxID=663 RepID=UPI003B9DEF20
MSNYDDRSCIRVRLRPEHTALAIEQSKLKRKSPTRVVEDLIEEFISRQGGAYDEFRKK